ncbi:hypothetical protein [Nocardioides montaniterrae]
MSRERKLALWAGVVAVLYVGHAGVGALALVAAVPDLPRGPRPVAIGIALGTIVCLAGPLGLMWMFTDTEGQVAPGRATTPWEATNLVIVGLDLVVAVGAIAFARRSRR